MNNQQTTEYQQPSRREFERGGAAMTDKPKPRPKPQPKRVGFGPDQGEILASLAHKSVEIGTLDGKVYRGILLSVDQFTLGVTTPEGDAMFFKSAVKFVRAVKSNGSPEPGANIGRAG